MFFSRYSGINSLEILSTYRKDIRDLWVETKFAFQWGLPARYWKNALDEAISNINSGWSNTFLRVKMATKRNSNLTADEKDFIYYVLKAIPILHSILNHRAFKKPERVLNLIIREKYIYNLIGRYVRKYKGTISFSKKKRSFFIDAPMYKYKTIEGNNIIEITGLVKFDRIDIILKDKNVHSGGLRIVIADDNSVIIHKVKL